MLRSLIPGSIAVAVAIATGAPADAGVVSLSATQDNTLYQSPAGDVSNGHGEYFFAGSTFAPKIRRALIAFDFSSVPAGATMTKVTLRLHLSNTQPVPSDISLHRVSASWGEGASDPKEGEGAGAPAEPGDATWLYRFYDTKTWRRIGGDFARASGTWTVDFKFGFYEFSGQGLPGDVTSWIADPSTNFGWCLTGDEVNPGTTKRFDSRENIEPTFRPVLDVTYAFVGDLDGDDLVSATDLAILLGSWGTCEACSADLDANGAVDAADLAMMLGSWSAGG